jgi:hypothetical protein
MFEFSNNFMDIKDKWTSFWNNELEEPLFAVTAPKPGVKTISKPTTRNIIEAIIADDISPLAEQIIEWRDSHDFFGAAIPFFYLEFGPDHFSALVGGDLEWNPDSPDTTWSKQPFITDINNTEIKFCKKSKWWERTVKFITELREACDDKVLIAAPTLVSNLDCLCAIRGTQELLLDMVMNPEGVNTALEQINCAHKQIADALHELVGASEYGSITRHGVYSPQRAGVIQCDFSAMISPEMFEGFVIPSIVKETKSYDHCTYHLDGPDAIRHLELICNLDQIGIIQWVAGSGNAATTDWTDLHVKIDNLGKGQILWGKADYMRVLAEKLNSRKLFFIHTASSLEDAENFINLRN